jgi:CheY-like chemotaxis protein
MHRILVIDDDAPTREFIARTLDVLDVAVRTAETGEVAVMLFEDTPADLVVTDLIMPGIFGLDAVKRMRRLRPDLKVIAVSGGFGLIRDRHYKQMEQDAGIDTTLSKPLKMDELLQAVKRLLATGG